MSGLPDRLASLYACEVHLRLKAEALVTESDDLKLHLTVIEAAMDLLASLVEVGNDDEDDKVIQVLGIRAFNGFASAISLALTGYSQTAGMVLRDVLETTFLVDRFRTDRAAITRWRNSNDWREFSPKKVRDFLDKRDGFEGKKREQEYKLITSLAGHPSMQGIAMLRPAGGEVHIGPFLEQSSLIAVLSQAGKIAIQLAEVILPFVPLKKERAIASAEQFSKLKREWVTRFYLISVR